MKSKVNKYIIIYINNNYVMSTDIELNLINFDRINYYCNHTSYYTEYDIENECCICLDTIDSINTNYYITRCCKQNLHMECYMEWIMITFNNFKLVKCPICRTETTEDIINKDVSLKDLIEFKLHKPKYTIAIYKFIDNYYKNKNYILPIPEYNYAQLISRIDNNNSTDLENQLSRQNIDVIYLPRTPVEKAIYYVKLIIFFVLIIGLVIVYMFTLNNNHL